MELQLHLHGMAWHGAPTPGTHTQAQVAMGQWRLMGLARARGALLRRDAPHS